MSSRYSTKKTVTLTKDSSSMRNSQVDTDWILPSVSSPSVAALRISPVSFEPGFCSWGGEESTEDHDEVMANILAVKHHCQENNLCTHGIEQIHSEYIGGPFGYLKKKAGQVKDGLVTHTKKILGQIKVLQLQLKKSQAYWTGLVAKKKAMLARGASAYMSEKWLKAEEIEKKVTEDLIPKIQSAAERISQTKLDIRKAKIDQRDKKQEAAQAKHDAQFDRV